MNAMRTRASERHATERGAALMVAMIMVFALSLMGVSAMRNSTLEQQMAVNSILANDVLQVAESANEIVLNDRDNLTAAYLAPSDTMSFTPTLREEVGMTSRVVLSYVGEGNAVGASLDARQGANSFDALRYVASSEARIDAVRARRRIDQGAYRNAPSN